MMVQLDGFMVGRVFERVICLHLWGDIAVIRRTRALQLYNLLTDGKN